MIPAQAHRVMPVMNMDRFTEPSCRYFERKDLGEWRGGVFVSFPIVYCSHHQDRCPCHLYQNRIEVF